MAERQILRTIAEKVDPRHAAVIVVDVQNDFCAEDNFFEDLGFDTRMIRGMVPRLVTFLDQARAAGARIVFIRSIYDEHYLSEPMIERNLRRQLLIKRCQSGTRGVDFYMVAPQPGEPVVTKHRYSAFQNTDLHVILRSWGIRTLIMTGVTTNVCVESTAREGYFLDHHIVFLSDCTATTNEDRRDVTSEDIHRWTLTNIELTFGVVATSDEVVRAWKEIGALKAAGARR